MEVGGSLAQKWSFPQSLIDTIRHHHMPETATRNHELTHIVYLSDLLMSRFNTGIELERVSTEALSSRLETIGLSVEKFPDIVDIIPVSVFGSSPEIAIMENKI